jgi:hypothetical protein
MTLRSPSSGVVTETLGQLGQPLTNNGIAESPDGKNIYVTLIGKKQLYIEQISTVTKKQTFFADGVEPAVSPDDRYVAYSAGPDDTKILAVKSLSTGRTSSVNLSSLLGSSTSLMTGTITWLGNGSDIVVMPSPDAVATASIAPPAADSTPRSCRDVPQAVCLIVVHLNTSDDVLTSHLVTVSGISGNFNVIAGAGEYPSTLVMAAWGEKTNLYDMTLAGSTVHVTHLVTLPAVLPVAFDLVGSHLFYISGHGPAELWIAKMT